jgi:nucleoside-diphosphate-sugar epimerase
VLGGTGFVGRRVVETLQGLGGGIRVISTSRDGREGTIAWDATTGDDNTNVQTIQELAKGCTAVISCIGAIGTSDEVRIINAATGLAAQGAKSAGVDRFVYVSVSPEVKRATQGIEPLQNYMKGKEFSQESIIKNFPSPGSATIIEPTFIFGGDKFSLNPPRVAGFYGEFIESLLSSGPVRGITNVLPDGFIKIALEPPISVDDVAAAACAGALGKSTVTELDSYDKIVEASTKLG